MTCKHKPGDTCGPECEPSAGLRESVVSHAELYLILRELGLEHKRPCDWSMEKVLALEVSLNDRIAAALAEERERHGVGECRSCGSRDVFVPTFDDPATAWNDGFTAGVQSEAKRRDHPEEYEQSGKRIKELLLAAIRSRKG